MKPKLVRTTTVPISMNIILRGQLEYMNQYFEVIGVTGEDKKHFREIGTREGIRMHSLEMARGINLIKDIKSLWAFFWFLREEKPEIIHTHTPKAGLIGMLAGWLARVPIRLHTVGGMPLVEIKGLKRLFLAILEKFTYRLAHRVYPNSYGLMEIILANKFCFPQKLKVIANGGSNGINTSYFNPDLFTEEDKVRKRREIGLGKSDLVLCFVGRIAREKGIRELIDAVTYLVEIEKIQNIHLILVGGFEKDYGVLDTKYKSSINELPYVKFLGRFDDVRPYYAISNIFVLPSYREGFPNAVLEAGAMGLPAIVSNINGCNEIVQDQYNGLIIPSKDTRALSEAIKTLVLKKEKRLQLGAHARNRILNNYKREYIWEELLKEYYAHLKEISQEVYFSKSK